MNLKSKLTGIVLGLLLVTLAGVATLSFIKSGTSIKKVYSENTLSLVNSTSEYLETYFDKYILILEDYSEDEIFLKNEIAINSFLMTKFDNLDSILSLYYGSANGDMIIAPNEKLPDDYDPRQRPWYKLALDSDEVVISEPYIDSTKNITIVSLSKKIVIDNKVRGVISLDLTLNSIEEVLSKKAIGRKGYFFLTTKDGLILSHPDENLLGKKVGSEINAGELSQYISAGKPGIYNYKYNGEDKTIGLAKFNNWILIGTFTNDELIPYVIPLLRDIAIIAIISLILVGGVIFFYIDKTVKPIQYLSNQLNQLSN